MLPDDLHPHAAAMVFDSWAPDKDRPEQVGYIRCCGQLVVMTQRVIECATCGTSVEVLDGGRWKILKAANKAKKATTGHDA